MERRVGQSGAPELIPNMPERRLAPLMAAFAQAVTQASTFSGLPVGGK